MESRLKDILLYTIITTIVVGLWILLELIIEGKNIGSTTDTIIALLFSWFIFINYKYYKNYK